MSLTSSDVEPDGNNPAVPGTKILSLPEKSFVLTIRIVLTQEELRRGLESRNGTPSPFANWLEYFRISWERLESGLIRLASAWKEGEKRDRINHIAVLRTPANAGLEPCEIEMHVLLAPDADIADIPKREAIYFPLGIILLAWPDRDGEDGYWNVTIEPLAPFAKWKDGQYGVTNPHRILLVDVPPNLHQRMTETREWN